MVSMQHALNWILMSLPSVASCPFNTDGSLSTPNDAIHQPGSLRGRRLVEKMTDFIDDRVKHRALLGECFSDDMYDAIHDDVIAISDDTAIVANIVEKAHFFGGIVRLAAHDFMDYNGASNSPMGADGCFDGSADENKGLETIWCEGCPLTLLYETFYSQVSKADFWVASANAVIKHTSDNADNGLDLKSTFQWGRVDADSCEGSAILLPGSQGCSEVERVFLDRLDMDWTDAVALIGAHTLGRGDRSFSGHHGIWDVNEENSLRFDNGFYRELLIRPWVPRNDDDGVLPQDWTWGGAVSPDQIGDSPRFALNTDLCLVFDVETTFPCCTNNNTIRNNGVNACDAGGRDLSNTLCGAYPAGSDRAVAADAVQLFGGGSNTNANTAFYEAFATAWKKATNNGWSNLHDLKGTCEATLPPSEGPTTNPTTSPTSIPTSSPTVEPSGAPSTSLSPSATCRDFDDLVKNQNGVQKNCDWVIENGRCKKHAHNCPKSCNDCDCRPNNWVCKSNDDCCSSNCGIDGECKGMNNVAGMNNLF